MARQSTAAAADEGLDEIDLGQLIETIWVGKWLIALWVVLGTCLGVFVFVTTAKVYQADALVQLESTLKFACSERSTLDHDSLSALNSVMSSQVKAKDARLTTAEGLVSHIYSFDKYLHSF